jgi:hypothetical protein
MKGPQPMSDKDFIDPLPALQAEIDQMIALAPELARAAQGIFSAYRSEGFTANQALYLTAAQLHTSPGNAPS